MRRYNVGLVGVFMMVGCAVGGDRGRGEALGSSTLAEVDEARADTSQDGAFADDGFDPRTIAKGDGVKLAFHCRLPAGVITTQPLVADDVDLSGFASPNGVSRTAHERIVIVGTNDNRLLAFNANGNGSSDPDVACDPVWTATAFDADEKPLGITSTPAIADDGSGTRRIFVVSAVDAGHGREYRVFRFDQKGGSAVGVPLGDFNAIVPPARSDSDDPQNPPHEQHFDFDSATQGQQPGLLFVPASNGRPEHLFIGFGADGGDATKGGWMVDAFHKLPSFYAGSPVTQSGAAPAALGGSL